MIRRLISLVLSTLLLVAPIVRQNREHLAADKAEQPARLAALEQQYADGKIAPVNEADFFDGDLYTALANGIKFNELSFVATHNSYQTASVPALRQMYANLSKLTFGLVKGAKGGLDSETPTEQLNLGIRSLEIDIETMVQDGKTSFVCIHSPVYDMTTSCYDLALTLKEIKMWSDHNPNHLPVTIIIEPKKSFIPLRGMRFLNLKYTNALDDLLRETLGDKLFTPADMLRDYDSFAQMRFADDWCEVRAMLGKVLILLHDTNVTQKYIKQDPSIKSQAMFPMLRYSDRDESFASFLLINQPEEARAYSEEIVDRYNLIMRTQADTYTSVSAERLENAVASRAQILSTDFPMKAGETTETHFVYYGDHKTIRAVK